MKFLLSCLPLPESVIQACSRAGFRYYEDFFNNSGVWLQEASKLLEPYDWSRERIEALISPPISSSAFELLENEGNAVNIATFSEAIDEVLGGGVFLGSLLHVVGPPGAGKTQFLLQLCIDVQLPETLGGVSKEAVFIDSENAFSVSRLEEICSGAYNHCMKVAENCNFVREVENLNVDQLVSGIHYMPVNCNPVDLFATLNLLEELILTNSKIGLVVLDSFTICFLPVTKTIDRTRIITNTISTLRQLAETHQVAVVVANDLTTRLSETGEKVLVPALGETLSHLMPTTLLLSPPTWPTNYFTAIMYKSSSLPRATAKFQIVKDGIRDVIT